SLTVGYEQARGMRQPGQRPDGTFDANVSKTVAVGAEEVFPHLTDDDRRAAWLDDTWHVASASAPKRLRLESTGGDRALVEVTAVPPGQVRLPVPPPRFARPAAVGRAQASWPAA